MHFPLPNSCNCCCFSQRGCVRRTDICLLRANLPRNRSKVGSPKTSPTCSTSVIPIPSEDFLDSSVLLAACGSKRGASFEVIQRANTAGWHLVVTPYVIEEVLSNLAKLGTIATAEWAHLRPQLIVMDDVLTLPQAVNFGPAKDRPILFSALAWAEVLLTLDRGDFGEMLGGTFYGL
jgi:hypothetical protein